jgi:hypothetical protein
MKRVVFGCTTLLCTFISTASYGYSAVVDLDDLIAEAEMIVVVKVKSVRVTGNAPAEQKIATAEILDAWKGEGVEPTIDYVASPGWFSCDTSDARVGETVVLFLARDQPGERFRIAHFGRGRMRVAGEGKQRRAEACEVIFPSDGARFRGNKTVGLDELARLVSSTRPSSRTRTPLRLQ